MPHDEIDFSRVLDALWTRGFLVKYGSGTDIYGWVPKFKEHQFINNRELKSDLPEPNENNMLTRAPRVPHGNSTRLYLEKAEHIKGKDKRERIKGKDKRKNFTRQPRVVDASPSEILSGILSGETAQAIVEHRAKLKSPLTAHAAKLLARQFSAFGDPTAAAEEMIARGWKGFKPEWMANQARSSPINGRHSSFMQGIATRCEELAREGKRESQDGNQAGPRDIIPRLGAGKS